MPAGAGHVAAPRAPGTRHHAPPDPPRPLLLLTALSALVAPPSLAHDGNDGGLLPLGLTLSRPEGECYETPDAACDPLDGVPTQVEFIADASGNAVAFLPGPGCGISFPDILVPSDGRFLCPSHLAVEVDGQDACASTACMTQGFHDVRIEFTGTSGTTRVDYVDYTKTTACA